MLIYLLGTLLQDAHQPLNNLFNLSVLRCSLGESDICTGDEGEVFRLGSISFVS